MEKNFIALDVLLITRLMEEARENIESDADLHILLEAVLEQQLSNQDRVLTMDDYDQIMETYIQRSSNQIEGMLRK